jgi:hypothetical protein
MSEETENQSEPSQSTANAMLRVLNGKRLKWTVVIHLPDGKKLEWQAVAKPHVKWNDEDRCLWLMDSSGYSNSPVMKWPEGAVILCEDNEPDKKP